jgi:hypothetical protein
MSRLFKPNDIKWIKNVNTPTEDAYLNLPTDNFKLYFPDQFRANASKVEEVEIILLHQNINERKVFTHLVTPVDMAPAKLDYTRPKHRAYRNVKIVAITPFSDQIVVSSTLWKNVKFKGIGQGNACNIRNITSVGDNYFELVEDVWNRFIRFFR